MQTPVTTHSTPLVERPAEYDLYLTGAARLTLVLNLERLVDPDDRHAFQHLRGSESYAAALRALSPPPPFARDEQADEVEQSGYALRVFRSRLIQNHFFPTYRAAWDDSMRNRLTQAGCADISSWQHWNARVRLTRNGLAVVMLERPLQHVSLIQCVEQMLELRGTQSARGVQDQWWLGYTVLQSLLDSLERKLTIAVDGRQKELHFANDPSTMRALRLDRYVIYSLQRIERDDLLVMPDELKTTYAPLVAALMEGSLVEHEGVRRLPGYDAEAARILLAQNGSTWTDELCLFTGESALLYRPLEGKDLAYLGGPMGLNTHAYRLYWAALERGVEHLVAFRSEAQQAEGRTTKLLGAIPHLTRRMQSGEVSPEDINEIEHLAAGLSDIFDSLPEQRSQLVTATAFRSDYVRQKFDRLIEALDIPQTLELVNTNVEQLNFFLSYYNDMRLQWQGQKSNQLTLVLTVVLMFLALSSFLSDTFNVLNDANTVHGPFTEITWALICFGALTTAVVIWRAWRLAQARRK